MRLNRFVATATGIGRRQADVLINEGRIQVDSRVANIGQSIKEGQKVTLDNRELALPLKTITIILNKPAGYIVSRKGQGGQTIYDLLPLRYGSLKPVGRLDKDSSGLLILSNNGELINQLAHPSFDKPKVYKVKLDRAVTPKDLDLLAAGVKLEDGLSHLQVEENNGSSLIVVLYEGRNRQIRRTFAALKYSVTKLERLAFWPYNLEGLKSGEFKTLD